MSFNPANKLIVIFVFKHFHSGYVWPIKTYELKHKSRKHLRRDELTIIYYTICSKPNENNENAYRPSQSDADYER